MSFLKGEDITVGIARETVRGTPETPTVYVPGRVPTGIKRIVEKAQIRETRGNGMSSVAAVPISDRAEGDLEFNVRNGSIGMIFLSLLGSVSTSTAGSGYLHQFDLLTGNPQNPTLTLGLAQNGQQDYEYAKCLVTSLEIRTPVDDLVNATATFVGVEENTHAAYTVAYASTDYYFRHYDVVIKIAANVAGLGAASALGVKEFNLTIGNSGRVNQNIGELNPSDVLALMMEVTGNLKIDYQDETYHDLYAGELYKAMSITMTRADIELSTGVNPKVEIIMPRVSLSTRNQDRPIDDIVTDDIEFNAHHDETTGYGIRVNVTNSIANYN